MRVGWMTRTGVVGRMAHLAAERRGRRIETRENGPTRRAQERL
ncbi:MAG: hypothetical protein JWL62_345 [Hyphomicrobiales bacterium]|nr:hypothetical protein [Hyphomicrobiales bacterium]